MNNNINITKILLLVFLCTISFSANAQKVGELFLSMPDKILPTLSKQQRFEMLEYSKLNRRDSVKNKFNVYSDALYCWVSSSCASKLAVIFD
jgi:hypothetical protein